MRRITLSLLVAAMALVNAMAQEVNDTVATSNNMNDVYYNLHTGEKTTVDQDNWDIAFENKGFTASILINGQKGVKLYSSPYAAEDWSKFDSTGFGLWPATINSSESWSGGAFNQNLVDDFDLGWGTYDVSTHKISADSVFFIALANGGFKKIFINELAGGVYKFTYADADGSSEKTVELKKSDIGDQNFGFYSIENEKFVMREPHTDKWDLVFTQYEITIPIGGGKTMNYPVSGVKINKNVQVAQRDGMDVEKDDTAGLNWNTNITEIGSDWKTWSGTEYTYAQDRVYFVKLQNEQVWKLYFTKYSGGTHYFVKEKIQKGVNVKEVTPIRATIYPNPANGGVVTVQLEDANTLKSVNVYNSAMQLVNRQVSNEIQTAELATGMYYISIETTRGRSVQPLIIK
jgi:hypothetical protein